MSSVDVRVTYGRKTNAAYMYFTDPEVFTRSSHVYPCYPVEVNGMINLDFDEGGRLIGIEVLDVSLKLPAYLLDRAERIDVESVD